MKKIVWVLFLSFISYFAVAVDLSKEVGKKKDSIAEGSLEKLSSELKNVQNEKGPIVFKTGKADLNVAKCKNTLEAIANIINKYPGLIVQIEGHTDNKGNPKKNRELSQKRAQAVVAWLIKNKKIPAKRLKAKGFGDSQPLADNNTEAGRAKNRRVDFSVTKP